MKKIKADALARPIAVVEPTMNKGGNKRSSPPAQEMLVEKKLKTSSSAREGLLAVERPMFNLTFFDWKKK
ncbi:hypothetical protein ACFX10_033988 [Malus domestica]